MKTKKPITGMDVTRWFIKECKRQGVDCTSAQSSAGKAELWLGSFTFTSEATDSHRWEWALRRNGSPLVKEGVALSRPVFKAQIKRCVCDVKHRKAL